MVRVSGWRRVGCARWCAPGCVGGDDPAHQVRSGGVCSHGVSPSVKTMTRGAGSGGCGVAGHHPHPVSGDPARAQHALHLAHRGVEVGGAHGPRGVHDGHRPAQPSARRTGSSSRCCRGASSLAAIFVSPRIAHLLVPYPANPMGTPNPAATRPTTDSACSSSAAASPEPDMTHRKYEEPDQPTVHLRARWGAARRPRRSPCS